MANILNRRSFLKAGFQTTAALGLASLAGMPAFVRRALAEGSIGANGKKLIFIFLRGGNDGVNNVIPVLDPSYKGTLGGTGIYTNRHHLAMPLDPALDYSLATGTADVQASNYPYAVRLGNGFATLNPALADLAPVFNAGDLAVVHRAGYRSLNRSHFDSEIYWEKATDGIAANNRLVTDGVWYRTIAESGWNLNHALSGVSIQSNLPQSLRGPQPMTNLSSIGRYNILGVAGATSVTNGVTVASDRSKILRHFAPATSAAHAVKDNRDLLHNLGTQFLDTLETLQEDRFQQNTFLDVNDGNARYPGTLLFPSTNAQDLLIPGTTNQYRVGSSNNGNYGFMGNIRSCAQLLNHTDAIITGTEIGGWDTHTAQVAFDSTTMTSIPNLGGQASLLRRVGAAYYAIWRYFTLYGKGGSQVTLPPTDPNYPKVGWDDVVVVTMSEFGRTSAENDSMGTDHAEASAMYVAGGAINGGVYGCSLATDPRLVTTTGTYPNPNGYIWNPGNGAKNGALYESDANVGYLRRVIDYRSVLGELIRDHLGATQGQLNRIIPAYASEGTEKLMGGGLVGTTPATTTPILGELGLV